MFFFFKQKTAYEMRISDWSSDVCSSDLSPQPGGTPSATTATRAPTESPDLRRASMNVSSSGTCAASGQKNGLSSTALQSCEHGTTSPICARCPRTHTPKRSASHFFAITAAATRIVVSRADERPPPRSEEHTYELQSLIRISYDVLF